MYFDVSDLDSLYIFFNCLGLSTEPFLGKLPPSSQSVFPRFLPYHFFHDSLYAHPSRDPKIKVPVLKEI